MFSPKDLNAIKKLIDQSFNTNLSKLENKFEDRLKTELSKLEIKLSKKNLEAIKLLIRAEFDEGLDEKLKQYFDKDKMYQKLDYIAGKLDADENERVLVVNTQEDHENRLVKLEELHPKNKHAFVVTP